MTVKGSHFLPACAWEVVSLTQTDLVAIDRYNVLTEERSQLIAKVNSGAASLFSRLQQYIPGFDPQVLQDRLFHAYAGMGVSIPQASFIAPQVSEGDRIKEIDQELDLLVEKLKEKAFFENDRYIKTPRLIEDKTTGDVYLNQSQCNIRSKGALLILGTIYQLFAAVGILGQRLAALSYGDRPLKQLGHILLLPFILIGLFFASIWTVVDPLNGRKIYATLERLMHEDLIDDPSEREYLAPCFQPRNIGSKVEHFFGGQGSNGF